MARPDVSDERRSQIIEAAIKVFIRKGYRKTTMPDIASEAGLSIGGVYWYFKGKDEIVLAMLAACFQSDLEAINALLNADAPASDRLKTFFANYLDLFATQGWLNVVGIEFYGEAAHNPVVREFVQKYLADYRRALVQLIEQGIQRGEFRSVNALDAANAFLGLEEGLTLLLAADSKGVDWAASFKTGTDLFLTGLMAPKK
ncbi:MAG: TetR/AcrR family transcriptional regulator [Anaerolineales bacterium]